MNEKEYPPTLGSFPIKYVNRKLFHNRWPIPQHDFRDGKYTLDRTHGGLEAVPGYFQYRMMGPPGHKTRTPVHIDEFQRRRGVGFRGPDYQAVFGQQPIPIDKEDFLRNYTNKDLYGMRRTNGMYKLLFWNPKMYTPLQAYQWNRYLDENPNHQHEYPIPRMPNTPLPPPPYPYNELPFYDIPEYNNRAHQYAFSEIGASLGKKIVDAEQEQDQEAEQPENQSISSIRSYRVRSPLITENFQGTPKVQIVHDPNSLMFGSGLSPLSDNSKQYQHFSPHYSPTHSLQGHRLSIGSLNSTPQSFHTPKSVISRKSSSSFSFSPSLLDNLPSAGSGGSRKSIISGGKIVKKNLVARKQLNIPVKEMAEHMKWLSQQKMKIANKNLPRAAAKR